MHIYLHICLHIYKYFHIYTHIGVGVFSWPGYINVTPCGLHSRNVFPARNVGSHTSKTMWTLNLLCCITFKMCSRIFWPAKSMGDFTILKTKRVVSARESATHATWIKEWRPVFQNEICRIFWKFCTARVPEIFETSMFQVHISATKRPSKMRGTPLRNDAWAVDSHWANPLGRKCSKTSNSLEQP